jgi:hypothetical protein
MSNQKRHGNIMKTIMATLLGIALLAGFAGQSSAASSTASTPSRVAAIGGPSDYDSPAFGTQQWWDLHDDQG